MMNARLGYLLIGCVIGFVLGYIVRSLREIKDKVDVVDEHVTQKYPNDEGFIRPDWAKNIALFLVVLLTAYSAFASQKSSNDVKTQQKASQTQQQRTDKLVSCNQEFLTLTIAALNARTTYSQDQNSANVDLQKSLSTLVTFSLQTPPLGPADARRVVEGFAAALKHFLEISAKSASKVQENPYPTSTEFLDCLKKK